MPTTRLKSSHATVESKSNKRLQRHDRTVRVVGATLLVFFLGSDDILAQPPRAEIVRGSGGHGFPTDRRVMRIMERARESIDREAFAEGVTLLQRILDGREDLFHVDRESRTSPSLKAEALRTLAAMPAVGIEAYEIQFGTQASRLLDSMAGGVDVAVLEEVVRRYFHTASGYRAAYLLASHHFDCGHHREAALWFDRLRRQPRAVRQFGQALELKAALCWAMTGQFDRGVNVLTAALKSSRDGLRIRGQAVRDVGAATRWLKQAAGGSAFPQTRESDWPMFARSANRNGSTRWASPVAEIAWDAATLDPALAEDPTQRNHRDAAAGVLRTIESNFDGSDVDLPAPHAIVVEDYVVFRGPDAVKAYDRRTGRFLWHSLLTDPTFDRLVDSASTSEKQLASRVNRFLFERIWGDTTAGILSSDGQNVFVVDELSYEDGLARGAAMPGSGTPAANNKLVAYDLHSGKLLWDIGGPRGEIELQHAGAFFLGAPLPVGGRLYCLAESGAEIHLLVLDPHAGSVELAWSQVLYETNSPVQHNKRRRSAGITPSHAGGLLICPTASGAVVAVDIARRMFRWGYRYPTTNRRSVSNPRAARMIQLRERNLRRPTGWEIGIPQIGDRHVVLTPIDSDEVHCLDLETGELRWKENRQSYLYAAAIVDDSVVLVGRSGIEARDTTSGKIKWQTPLESPAGTGVRFDTRYVIPLSTGELVSVDLANGRILGRSECPHGLALGNLVASRGSILSLGPSTVVSFQPLPALENRILTALARDGKDAEALRLRGELALHRGDNRAALEDLRASLTAAPSRRAKQLVVSTMLEAMRLDFESTKGQRDNVLDLMDNDAQRARYWQLLAAGLHRSGDYQSALEAYVALNDSDLLQTHRLGNSHTLRTDRWVQGRLRDLFTSANAEQRQSMAARLDEELRALGPEASADDWRQVRRLFGHERFPGVAGLGFAESLDPNSHGIERELVLRRLRRSSDPVVAARATFLLATLLLDSEQSTELPQLANALADSFGDQIVDGERTAGDIVATWKNDPAWRDHLNFSPQWPDKPLVSQKIDGARSRLYPVRMKGTSNPAFADISLAMDQRGKYLTARNGAGEPIWQLSSQELGVPVRNVFGNPAWSIGHLLALSLGDRFVVLDTLQSPPRFLWSQKFASSSERTGVIAVAGRAVTRGGVLGVVNDSIVCFQSGSTVVAADPLTGETLWKRSNVAPGSQVTGNDELVYVTSPDQNVVDILRAIDGVHVEQRDLEPPNFLLHTPYVCKWSETNDGSTATVRDLRNNQVVWSDDIAANTQFHFSSDEELGVLTPEGRFEVVDLSTGKPQTRAELPPLPKLSSVLVMPFDQHYVVIASRESNARQTRMFLFPLADNRLLLDAIAFGIRKSDGKVLWSTEIGDQAIDLDQRNNLPVLVLASRDLSQVKGSRRTSFSVMLLDKRNGDVVFRDDRFPATYAFDILANRREQEIVVNFYSATVRLRFDDKPDETE